MCGMNNGATGSKNKHFCRKKERFCNRHLDYTASIVHFNIIRIINNSFFMVHMFFYNYNKEAD